MPPYSRCTEERAVQCHPRPRDCGEQNKRQTRLPFCNGSSCSSFRRRTIDCCEAFNDKAADASVPFGVVARPYQAQGIRGPWDSRARQAWQTRAADGKVSALTGVADESSGWEGVSTGIKGEHDTDALSKAQHQRQQHQRQHQNRSSSRQGARRKEQGARSKEVRSKEQGVRK